MPETYYFTPEIVQEGFLGANNNFGRWEWHHPHLGIILALLHNSVKMDEIRQKPRLLSYNTNSI